MGCKNTYLLTALVVTLLFLIVIKPINYDNHNKQKEYMANDATKQVAGSTYTYGDVPIIYNNDPSDINYYRLTTVNGNLNIPNSQILTNKNLYEYRTTTIPKEKNILNFTQNDKMMSQLVDDTYCCDDIMNRELVNSYLHDSSYNRYGSIRESYFD